MKDSTIKRRRSILNSLFKYALKPAYNPMMIQGGPGKKFWDIFRLWSLSVLAVGLFGYFIGLAIEKFGYDMSQHSVVDLFLNYPVYILIFFAFIWAPVTEELTFRMGLKYSPYRLGYSLVFFLILLVAVFISLFSGLTDFIFNWVVKLASWEIFALYIGFVVLVGWAAGRFLKRHLDSRRMEGIYTRYFHFIFYGSAGFFAAVHIFNFVNLGRLWFLAPLLIIPQLILGFVLGYVRMKYGLRWSIVFHFLHNILLSTPIILFSLPSDKLFSAIESGDEMALNEVPASDELLVLLAVGITIFVFLAVIISLISLLREYHQTG